MKKLHFLLLSVLITSFALANFDFGVKLGANYSRINCDEPLLQYTEYQFNDPQGIMGVNCGVYTLIAFNNFGIYLEGFYSGEGFSIYQYSLDDNDNNTIKIHTKNINATAMLRYNLPIQVVSPFISAGLCTGMQVGYPNIVGGIIDMDNFNFNKIALCVAGGVNIVNIVDIELRYVKGLNDIYSGVDGEITTSNLINLSLGVYFLEIFNRLEKHSRY